MAEQSLLFSVEEMTNLEIPEWDLPDLTALPKELEGDVIAIDLETKDDGIRDNKGSGWPWKGGLVVGYSIAAKNWQGYLPVAHATGGNLDHDKVRRILNHWLSNAKQRKVGAHILYDFGWADQDGVTIKGPLDDVQYAAALLDETRWSYSLDSLAKDQLNMQKDETLLRKAAGAWGVDPKGGLWQLPAQFVGRYAEMDAVLALKLHTVFQEKLAKEGLTQLYELETGLIRLYHDMRKRGVRVSEERAVQLRDTWRGGVANEIKLIKDKTGFEVDIWSAESLAKALRHENIPLQFTEKTHKVSITGEYLQYTDHWLCKAVLRARQLDKLAETFIDSAILGHAHNGRVHTELHPLRRNDNDDTGTKGTITGRMSSGNPNLQQVPTRSDIGNQLRTIFIPEEGEQWCSLDYSQQEPRMLVHFANSRSLNGKPLTGAADAMAKYQADPKLSFHKMVAEQTGLEYKKAKILNLALTYGRGASSTAKELNCTLEEAKQFIAQYHARLPFVKEFDAVLNGDVAKNSYVTTICGRRCRFTLFEPSDWEASRGCTPVPYWKAKKLWPNMKLRLAGIHKKLNKCIQGSSADQTKMAMKKMYDQGLGTHLVFPIHDEVCGSTPNLETTRALRDCMRDAIILKVPSLVTVKTGPTWGDLVEVEM